MNIPCLLKIALFSLIAFKANATDSSSTPVLQPMAMRYTESHSKAQFLFGMETASMTPESKSLVGYGTKLGFLYGFTPTYAVETSIAQAFGSDMSAIYSSFSGNIQYSLSGSFWTHASELHVKDQMISRVQAKPTAIWSVGAGVQQLFLSGTEQVFPAPGMGLLIAHSRKVLSWPLKFTFRYTQFVYQEKSFPGMFLNVDGVFGF